MTMTDEPIPSWLAFPGGEAAEPISEEQLEAFAENVAAALAADSSRKLADAVALALQPPPEGEEGSAAGRFRIEDDGLAEWAMRKLAAVQARRAEVAERAAGWRAEIDAWEKTEQKPLVAREAFFEGALGDYLRRLREADEKIKSRKLPSGTIKSTGSGPKVAIADPAAVIAWADKNLEGDELAAVVKTTREAMLSELRKVAEAGSKLIAERFHITLEGCEHVLVGQRDAGASEPAPPIVGEGVGCPDCEPEFGEQPIRTIESFRVEEIFEPCVRSTEGEEIPGAIVQPKTVSFSVKVGA